MKKNKLFTKLNLGLILFVIVISFNYLNLDSNFVLFIRGFLTGISLVIIFKEAFNNIRINLTGK